MTQQYVKAYINTFHPWKSRVTIGDEVIPVKWINFQMNAGEVPTCDIGVVVEEIVYEGDARFVIETLASMRIDKVDYDISGDSSPSD